MELESGEEIMKRESVIVKKRFLLVALFLLLVAGITFGYARLETTLTINGDTKISKVSWLVHFKNIQVTNGSYTNDGANSVSLATNDDTTLTYTVTLKQPGDFYEFTVDIVNDGTIDAKLDSITSETNDPDVASKPFITYEEANFPTVDSILTPGNAGKRTIRIRVEFPYDIRPVDLPTSDYTFTKTIHFNYVQNR